jgi:FkbM family methyltransferase
MSHQDRTVLSRLKCTLRPLLPARTLAFYRKYKQGQFRVRTCEHLFHGVLLSLYIEDEIAANWYEHDWPTMPEVDILESSKLRPGARVFNIGAHQGIVAMVLGAVVGPSGLVLAIEADLRSAEVGKRNVKRNGMEQVKVLHGAGAAVSGEILFTEEYRAALPEDRVACRTPAFSIDDLSAQYGPPDVIFVDVEGYECQVLEGARQTLENLPDCFIEVHVGVGLESFGGSAGKVLDYLRRPGYRLVEAETTDSVFRPVGTVSGIMDKHFYLAALGSNACGYEEGKVRNSAHMEAD